MNPNEEYLDNLLKSMNDAENQNKEMSSEEIEAMFATLDAQEEDIILEAPEDLMPEKFLEADEDLMPEEFLEAFEDLMPEEDVMPEEALEPEEDLMPEEALEEAGAVMPEETLDMTQEDIERLLEQAVAESEKLEAASEPEASEELDEINELLRKSDNNEAVDEDMLALLAGMEEPDSFLMEPAGEPFFQEDTKEPKEKKKREKKSKRKKKEQSNEAAAEETERGEEEPFDIERMLNPQAEDSEAVLKNEKKEKRKEKFSRLFTFLTEEDEEKTEKLTDELASNSEENEMILKELEQEDKAKRKKKKNKKGQPSESDEEADEEEKSNIKKKKEKKAPKPKREKKEKEPVVNGKKLSGKKIFFISVICLTVMAIIFIFCNFLSQTVDVRTAKKAFYEAEYVTCYQLLYGKDLNESETIIFEKAEVLSGMERRWDAYKNYSLMGKELEALDSLVQAPKLYDKLREDADTLNILDDLTAIYERILNELNEKYRISEEQARELAGYEDAHKYAEQLKNLIRDADSGETQNDPEISPEPMEDILPGEEELEEFNFIQ